MNRIYGTENEVRQTKCWQCSTKEEAPSKSLLSAKKPIIEELI